MTSPSGIARSRHSSVSSTPSAERVKELTALHATGRLLNEPESPGEVLAGIVELLPAAWQYPEITAARIATAGHRRSHQRRLN